MGIFDVFEMKQHCQAIGEYVLYLAGLSARNGCIACSKELSSTLNYIRDHLKNMENVLQKYDD